MVHFITTLYKGVKMRFVKADKPVTTNHQFHGAISLEVEVPQVESLEEFVTFAGGMDTALAFVNNNIETSAKNGGRAALRNAPDSADVAELKQTVLGIVRDYAPQAGGGTSAATIAKRTVANIKALVESGESFTREQLLEMLAAAK